MDDISNPNVEYLEITSALGSAVIAWSHCEEATEHSLRDLLTFHGLEKDPAHVVASTLDLRDRCSLAIALAYKLEAPRATIEKFAGELNIVQNTLRNKRNRLFHDSWMMQEGAIKQRSSSGPKLTRPQSHTLHLNVPDYAPVDAREVREFAEACLDASRDIHKVLWELTEHYFGERRAELDAQSPRRRKGWLHRLRQAFGRR